jgi:hypothetical protein
MAMSFPPKSVSSEVPTTPGPLEAASREKTVANAIWRFFKDDNSKWKWQQLSVQGEVISESARSHKDYEDCLADAKENGHEFGASQAKTRSVQTAPYYPK